MKRKDIDFSFLPNPLTGDLSTKTGSSATTQALKNIVLSPFYHRGFNIEFGTDIQLFNLTSTLEVQTLRDKVSRAVSNFDPSEVDTITVNFNEGMNEITVEIFYYEQNNADVQRVVINS